MKPLYRANAIKKSASLASSQTPKTSLTNLQHCIDAHFIKTGFDPNTSRFNFQLQWLLQRGELLQARHLFDQMPYRNTFSINMMISGYVQSSNLSLARELFDNMVQRTSVTWTILIGGYSRSNSFREAFKLFAKMNGCGSVPDCVTFATLLSGFSDPEMATELYQVHAHVVKLGQDSVVNVCNSLIDCYCKVHRLDLACQIFREIPGRDNVTFNALMKGFAKDGSSKEAIKLFVEMHGLGFNLSDFTFQTVLYAGIELDDLAFGQQVHGLAVKTNFVWNVFVGNALLDFYSKHYWINEVRELFNEMLELDGVSYNIIITAYAWIGKFKESIKLFCELQFTRFNRRNFLFATMLSIAASTLDLKMGQQLHSQVIVTTADSEVVVANSLVDMYAKCGQFKEAERVFVKLGGKSTVLWTPMISAKIQKGYFEEGLRLFNEMCGANVSANQATFASVLKASANLASISLGKQLHSCIIRSGFMSNIYCGSALLDMYAKCGSIKDAVQTFKEMPVQNLVSWNALIWAYAQNGDGNATLTSFEEMVQSGYQPDSTSFLCVLSACSHCGLVEEGLQYFSSMTSIYKLVPKREHYASLIDMLCRSGQFGEAEKLMAQMPFEADEIMWLSLLNSCRIHKNHGLAKRAATQLFNMKELTDAASYVTIANILAAAGEWGSVGKLKKTMRECRLKKVSAYSWVEIKQKVHVFSSNDKNHPQMKEILQTINTMVEQMENQVFICPHNMDDEMIIDCLGCLTVTA